MEEGMEKRLLVSFALSILVLFAFGWFYSTPTEEPDPGQAPSPPAPATVAEAVAPTPAAGTPPPGEALEAPVEGLESVQAAEAREVLLETDLLSLRFSNRGAVLRSARLLDYEDDQGRPLELIDAGVAETTGWPLAVATGDPVADAALEDALFVVEEGDRQIRMEYAAAGWSVVKTFRSHPGSYRIDVDVSVAMNGRPSPFSLVWQGRFGEQHSSGVPFASTAGPSIVYRDGAAFERLEVGDIEAPNAVPATAYVGVGDRYFLAMFLLPDPRPPVVEAVPVDTGEDDSEPTPRLSIPYPSGAVGLYVGPQQEQALAAVDPALTAVIDYGFFGVLARPMMFGLVLIHDTIVANWGWSIILLTLFINFVFFPLRLKQQLSMQKMQKIQPQMRTLQDKYKKLKPNDPRRQEVQAEMMGLYKKNGVNPLGGCLPLLLQMPFLIAVFWLLQVAIELRQAPWMLWINDLSAPDPYYVLPILFGVSMFAQQKMMPSTMDPTQAKIMMIMPLFLTVMFINSQSGLMLYWLTSNTFGVGQQFLIRKYWSPPEKPKRVTGVETTGDAKKPAEAAPIEVEAVEAKGPNEGEGRRRRRRKK